MGRTGCCTAFRFVAAEFPISNILLAMKIREKYSLEDNMVMDIVFSCLCPCLVICQLANEVEDREGGGGGAGPSVAKTATT